MAIAGSNFQKDSTYVDPTGGTTKTFSDLEVEGRNRIVYFDGSLPLTRSTATWSSVEPRVKVDAPNGYTQARRFCLIHVPLVLANGKRTIVSAQSILSFDVETPITLIDNLRFYGAQSFGRVYSAAFWQAGSTS